ncbi:MFS transporter [Flavihumibacter solisilvae]|uniref:MFS transporter n=1 Tax=Flavihumibacter solisilvae TaxID=1349421 RepID=A0A0C1IKM3_9BACT|nr:MFS transporter [Flavihumibacter solisilvae]KIC94735.1 MFS transporter [Flavihumibacter solisilvae]
MNNSTAKTGIWRVIGASSAGTLIEWYDFYIFGSLATVIASQFFPSSNPTAALLSTLATFAAGFIVRPFGALVFGRLGDIIGRKYTFLLTLVLMGGSTFAIGLVPGYERIGFAAPIIVLILRLLQGLALGGEYGGAATYVAEHAPANRRGYFTSWIQTTATLGLFLSLGVILLTRHMLDSDQQESIRKFNDWGWRIPFLISILLVLVSIYIRLKMSESPMFMKLKSEGKTSTNPIKESFGRKENLKMVLLALFGATMGQGVVWYTGQFYAQSFIENVCRVNFDQSRTILIWAIVFATPFFVVFGSLSDRIGRKWIMITGMLLAVLFYRPIYKQFLELTNVPALEKTMTASVTEQKQGYAIKHFSNGFSYRENETDSTKYTEKRLDTATYWKFVLLVFIQVIFVTMVYGPIAAFLVELFPTRIRYTSMSLPYHIGNGVFGGLTPFIATLLTTVYTGDKLTGLWYPLIIAAICMVIGAVYLSAKTDPNVND